MFFTTHLEFVPYADEAEFPGLLLAVPAVGEVLKELPDKAVLGLTDQTLKGHVKGVVVLLHKLNLKNENSELAPFMHSIESSSVQCCTVPTNDELQNNIG